MITIMFPSEAEAQDYAQSLADLMHKDGAADITFYRTTSPRRPHIDDRPYFQAQVLREPMFRLRRKSREKTSV